MADLGDRRSQLGNSGFNLKSISNESKWNLVQRESKGWEGHITNTNSVSVNPENKAQILEKTNNLEIENSQIAGGKEGLVIKSNQIEIDLQTQRELGIRKIHMERNSTQQVIEKEIEQQGEMNQLKEKNGGVVLKSQTLVGSNRISMDLQKNFIERSVQPKDPLRDDKEMHMITEETMRVVKEPQQRERQRVVLETTKMQGDQTVTEVIQQDQVRILDKMEVKKTIIELPKKKGPTKIAKIEITNKRTIVMDNLSNSSEKEKNIEVKMISKVNLETLDVKKANQDFIMKDLFQEIQSANSNNEEFCYQQLQRQNDHFQIKKEVLRQEIKKEGDEKMTVERCQQVDVLQGKNEKQFESTLSENRQFLEQTHNLVKDIPEPVYQSALKSMSLPTQTLQIMANKFNGRYFNAQTYT